MVYNVKWKRNYESGILFVGYLLGKNEICSQRELQVLASTFPSTDKSKSF